MPSLKNIRKYLNRLAGRDKIVNRINKLRKDFKESIKSFHFDKSVENFLIQEKIMSLYGVVNGNEVKFLNVKQTDFYQNIDLKITLSGFCFLHNKNMSECDDNFLTYELGNLIYINDPLEHNNLILISRELKDIEDNVLKYESLEGKFKTSYQEELRKSLQIPNVSNFAVEIFKMNPQNTAIALIAINPKKAWDILFEYFLNRIKEINDPNYGYLMQYTADPLENKLQNIFTVPVGVITPEDLKNIFQGVIFLDRAQENQPCYGSWQTTLVAAEKGKGPLLYSIAASFVKEFDKKFNKITPHRSSVKPAARAVWKSTYLARSDFKSHQLDDYMNPKTRTKWDDCEVHAEGNDGFYLNFAYEIKSPLNMAPFFTGFRDATEKITTAIKNALETNGSDKFDVEKIKAYVGAFFASLGRSYFSLRYSEEQINVSRSTIAQARMVDPNSTISNINSMPSVSDLTAAQILGLDPK